MIKTILYIKKMFLKYYFLEFVDGSKALHIFFLTQCI